jgi:hypothetical protein
VAFEEFVSSISLSNKVQQRIIRILEFTVAFEDLKKKKIFL